MKIRHRTLLAACLILFATVLYNTTNAACCDSCSLPKSLFLPRSQGVNAARELLGWQQFINRYDVDNFYGGLAATVEYSQSFNQNDIASYLFGPAICNGCITFSGSRYAFRHDTDVLADYFGLSPNAQSKVCFNPTIKNVITDFNYYWGLDCWAPNTYLRIHAPFVYSNWNLHACETLTQTGTLAFDLGYMAQGQVPLADQPKSILNYFYGCSTWGDMQTPLQYGKIAPKGRSVTRFADIQVVLGWNFLNGDNYHFGLNLQTSFPTGNKPNGKYLFEPIVGNGGYFELGFGITTHGILWRDCDCVSYLAFYLDANITHLFSTRQVRSFDFMNNGPLSRYMLVAQYQGIPLNPSTGTVQDLHLSNQVTTEYASSLQPAINLTTLCCDCCNCEDGGMWQGDLALKFTFKHCNWSFDLGYNFWGRSEERIEIRQFITPDLYALKGDSFMWGVAEDPDAATARANYPTNAVRLASSQAESATIFTGANFSTGSTFLGIQGELNPGVDSKENSQTLIGGTTVNVISPISNDQVTGQPISTLPIQTSNPTHFLSEVDLNPDSAASPSQISQKIFGFVSYAWEEGLCDNSDFVPFVGIGFEAEFGTPKPRFAFCKKCECNAALSQWSFLIKGGFGF